MTRRRGGARLNRRRFGQACLAAFAGAGAERLDRSRISVITDEAGLSAGEAAGFALGYGLRWVELRTVPGTGKVYAELPPNAIQEYRRQLDGLGLRVSFLNTWILKVTLPGTVPIRARDPRREEGRFERRLDYLRRAIETAHILDVDIIRIFTFWRVAEPAALYPRIAEIILEMAEVAEREGVRLLVENESACNVGTSAELVSLMERVPHPAIGINWDPHNSLPYEREPFPEGYRRLPVRRIGNVQIKGESILLPGEILDWGAITTRLLRDGYRGKFGLETHFGTGMERVRNAHASMKGILALAG